MCCMKILIVGGSGFIGHHLLASLEEKGHQVTTLNRKRTIDSLYWNPDLKECDSLENFDVVINLVGENIFGRWTSNKMRAIWESRVKATQFLSEKLSKLTNPPKLYIGASAIGY